jgi:hypothetical protein
VNVLDGAMKDTNDQTPVSVGDMIEPIIYKLHGSQDVARSCAISTEQYYWALWRLIDQKYIPDELGSIISLTPVVLVGSRILDADFRLTYTLLRSQLVAGNDEKRWAVVPRGGGDDRDLSYKLAKGAWTELCERALEKYSIRMLNESEDVFFRRLTEAFLARR